MFRISVVTLFCLCLGCGTPPLPSESPALSNRREISTSGYIFPLLSPDGRIIALIDNENGYPSEVRIWDRLANKDLAQIKCGQGDCRFSADGMCFVASFPNGEIRRYRTTTWESDARITIGPKLWDKSFGLLACSPDGKQVAFRTRWNCVVVWDIEKDRQIDYFKGQPWDLGDMPAPLDLVREAAYSPDGKVLAVVTGLMPGREDEDRGGLGELHLWDLGTGKHLFEDRLGWYLLDVAFSPDGKRVAAGGTHGAAVWDVADKKRGVTLWEGRQSCVNGLRFSTAGSFLLTGQDSGRITVWDVANGKAHSTLPTGLNDASHVAVSANTRLLVVVQTRTIYLWDLNLR